VPLVQGDDILVVKVENISVDQRKETPIARGDNIPEVQVTTYLW
jgi:hypothetical protein